MTEFRKTARIGVGLTITAQADLCNLSSRRCRLYNWSSTRRIHVCCRLAERVGPCGCSLTRLVPANKVFQRIGGEMGRC